MGHGAGTAEAAEAAGISISVKILGRAIVSALQLLLQIYTYCAIYGNQWLSVSVAFPPSPPPFGNSDINSK